MLPHMIRLVYLCRIWGSGFSESKGPKVQKSKVQGRGVVCRRARKPDVEEGVVFRCFWVKNAVECENPAVGRNDE